MPNRSRSGVAIRPERVVAPTSVNGCRSMRTERAAGKLGAELTDDGAAEIAKRARGTPRVATRLLRRVRDFASVDGKKAIDATTADKALQRLEVDALGLDSMDRRYLLCIGQKYAGGPVGVETLAAALSEARDAIEEVIEPFLIQTGLIQRTPRGRALTAAGYRHVGLTPPPAGAPQLDLLDRTGSDDA